MSLRDEHLKKALEHAPDRDLAPSDVARKNVLEYANNHVKQASQKPHEYKVNQTHKVSLREGGLGHWLAGLLSNVKNWQWAGMSSVAVALLAVIMLREQLPQEPVWRESDVTDIAQNTAPAPEKTLKEERMDATEYSAATAAAEPVPNDARTQENANAEAPASAPVLADKDNVVIAAAPEAQSATPTVQSSAPAEQTLAKQESATDAELRARTESAPASEAVAALPEQKDMAAKPAAAAKKSMELVDAGALGVAKANRDISAGVLRILVAEWPADKAQVDEATGYRVEVVTDLVPEELEAYNQTMRDRYLQQK